MAAFLIEPAACCVDGHFPDRAVVPAAVIADRIVWLVTAREGVAIASIRRIKFLNELAPGVNCEVEWHRRNGTIRFSCRASGVEIASGTLELAVSGDSKP